MDNNSLFTSLFALCVGSCVAAATSSAAFVPAGRGAAADIAKAIADTPDGGVVQLPDGRVFLESPVEINGRTNLTVRGGKDTVVILHYSPWEHPVWDHSPRFFIRNCSGVTFENIRVTTDNPVNASGRVVAKNPEDGTYEAEIDPQFPITGWEHFFASDSFDDDGTPDYVLATYDYWHVRTETLPDGKGGERKKTVALAYEVVGPQRIRVKASASALERLRIGHRVLYRYTVYGHSVFQIVASRDTVLRDIEIERCPSFGLDVLPPSDNLTLERFNMRAPEGDHALYAANADGVHILGLAGRFTMRDCHFLGLGDDALNIHAKSGEIAVFDSASGALKVICRDTTRKEVPLPRNWMAVGDTLAVHDSKTFLEKGRMVVTRFDGAGSAVVRIVDGSVAVGDFVANTRDMPSVEIEGCSVERTRARGFLLQTRHIRVRDCTFRCLSLPGIIIAPDFRGWFEAGPAEDVEISGSTFEMCGMNGASANRGAITVKTSHDDSLGDSPAGVHRDIRVFGNSFRSCGAAGIFIASASGVEVRDNVFENGWRNPPPNADPERRDVQFFHCDGIVSAAPEPAAFVLAERGKTADCAIIVPDDAPEPVRYAAEELRDFTEKTTGVRLPIVTSTTGRAVVLEVQGPKTQVEGPQTESFRLSVAGDTLHIIGGGPRGVLYGVYELLERFAGCRWYASWHTVAPERERIEVPADLDETHSPAFAMREPYWYDVRENQAFAARLRVNSRSWRTFDEKYGGNPYRFGGGLGSCHTFNTLLPPDKYFDEHPEYFSMVKGRRIKDRTQLCLTNPDVLRIVTSNVLERIRKDPGAKFYGVSQNDWYNFCECLDCKTVDDEEGSHAGTMVRFVNAIAEAVEKEFPDAIIETLAYQYTRKAPKKTKLRHNVVPCLCTIECDFARPLDESPFRENVAFRQDIEDWSKLTDFLYVWDYTTDFGHYLLPWANVYALQGNLRFFRRHNVKAIFEQGAFQGRHADFAELRAWLLSKWMWDPDLPMEPLLDDFFAGYYGKGAPFVREYFDKLHRLQMDYSANPEHPLLIFDGVENPALSDSFLEEAAELWTKAADAVKDDPATSYNVRMGAMSVDYARLERGNRLLNFTEPSMSPEKAKALAQSLLDRMAEAKNVRLAEADRSDTIAQWRKIAEGKVVLGKSESGELEDVFLPITNRGKWGDHVDDPKAGDGRALQLYNTHFQWCVQLSMSRIAFEPGRKYRLSVRVRVERAGDGEAFWTGVYSKGAATGRGGIEPRTTDIPDGEYHWYDVLEWVPAPDEYFWIGPGRFDENGQSAIEGVWVDKIAFCPVDR